MGIGWHESLSVGDERLDSDHQGLFALFDEMEQAVQSGQGRAAVGRTLATLMAYTVAHFRREEILMHEIGFPDLIDHAQEHRAIGWRVERLIEQHRTGRIEVTIETFSFLRDWLCDHVTKRDSEIARYARRHEKRSLADLPLAAE